MLEDAKVEEIRRLLRFSPFSQREIARRSGVSRGTVSAIAGGRYRAGSQDALQTSNRPDEATPAVRCRECGALVYPPCRACGLREQIARRSGIPA